MKTYIDCIPCFARQAVEAARMATDDEAIREQIVRKTLDKASRIPFDKNPPYMAMEIHRIVRGLVGDVDPYEKPKSLYNKKALEYYPIMKKIVAESTDRIESAVRLAIAGNNIDFGFRSNSDIIHLDSIIEETRTIPFAVNHIQDFKAELDAARTILYIGDNAGEIVFDRVLIEEVRDFRERVFFAVRGAPILNDVTRVDADEAGLSDIVGIVDTGCDAPGVLLDMCTPSFIRLFRKADLIIAKGQGNYETLSECGRPVFFLLKAKCPVIARDLSVETGGIVLKK